MKRPTTSPVEITIEDRLKEIGFSKRNKTTYIHDIHPRLILRQRTQTSTKRRLVFWTIEVGNVEIARKNGTQYTEPLHCLLTYIITEQSKLLNALDKWAEDYESWQKNYL